MTDKEKSEIEKVLKTLPFVVERIEFDDEARTVSFDIHFTWENRHMALPVRAMPAAVGLLGGYAALYEMVSEEILGIIDELDQDLIALRALAELTDKELEDAETDDREGAGLRAREFLESVGIEDGNAAILYRLHTLARTALTLAQPKINRETAE